jgi:hypothetical protein
MTSEFSESLKLNGNSDTLSRLRNIAYAAFEGLAYTTPEIVNSFEAAKEDIGLTAKSLVPALVIGATVGALTKYGGAAKIIGGGIMAAVGTAGLSVEAGEAVGSLRKAWNAIDRQEVEAAGKELSEQFGKFAFNSLLFAPVSTAGSYIGSSIRNRALQAELNLANHVGRSKFDGLLFPGSRINPPEPITGAIRDDNCIACVSALLRNKFGHNGMKKFETAHDVERLFGSTSAENKLNWLKAKEYVQTATGSNISSIPSRFGKPNTQPGHYAVLLKAHSSREQHLIYGRATKDGRIFCLDPQSGLKLNYKDISSGKIVYAFKNRSAQRSRPGA